MARRWSLVEELRCWWPRPLRSSSGSAPRWWSRRHGVGSLDEGRPWSSERWSRSGMQRWRVRVRVLAWSRWPGRRPCRRASPSRRQLLLGVHGDRQQWRSQHRTQRRTRRSSGGCGGQGEGDGEASATNRSGVVDGRDATRSNRPTWPGLHNPHETLISPSALVHARRGGAGAGSWRRCDLWFGSWVGGR